MKAAGLNLRETGDLIGFKNAKSSTHWRNGVTPLLQRWEKAAQILQVDYTWLMEGKGRAPAEVAEYLAWLLSDPGLPPNLRQQPKPMMSRRLKREPVDQNLEDAALNLGL